MKKTQRKSQQSLSLRCSRRASSRCWKVSSPGCRTNRLPTIWRLAHAPSRSTARGSWTRWGRAVSPNWSGLPWPPAFSQGLSDDIGADAVSGEIRSCSGRGQPTASALGHVTSVDQKNCHLGGFENRLGKATENNFTRVAMAVAAHNQQPCLMGTGGLHKHFARGASSRRHELDIDADAVPG